MMNKNHVFLFYKMSCTISSPSYKKAWLDSKVGLMYNLLLPSTIVTAEVTILY
jgi:hypothetical protein